MFISLLITAAVISSLDKYGNSPQLTNSLFASKRSLPSLIAIGSKEKNGEREDVVVVISVEEKRPGVIDDEKPKKVKLIHPSVAIIGSGLKSDLAFITHLLRRQSSRLWERYDTFPGSYRISISVSQILLAFMGYNNEDEIEDGVAHVLRNDSDGKMMTVGRPLTNSIVVCEIGRNGPKFKALDPSGIILEPSHTWALGKGCEKCRDLLRNEWEPHMSVEAVKDMCMKIIHQVALEEDLSLTSENDDISYGCEVFSSQGLSYSRIRLGNNAPQISDDLHSDVEM